MRKKSNLVKVQIFSSCRATNTSPILTADQLDGGFALYKIAFQWYSIIGVITMWIPTIIVSHLTGGTDFKTFNFKLLSPCIEAVMPRKYRHTELKLISSVDQPKFKSDHMRNGNKETGCILQNDENQSSKT